MGQLLWRRVVVRIIAVGTELGFGGTGGQGASRVKHRKFVRSTWGWILRRTPSWRWRCAGPQLVARPSPGKARDQCQLWPGRVGYTRRVLLRKRRLETHGSVCHRTNRITLQDG